jgi:cytochrome c-type biogenesis protein CcmH/NrfG
MDSKNYCSYLLDAFILLFVVAVVYGRLLGYDFIINGDDNLYVLDNPTIRGFSWGHIRDAFRPGTIGQYNPLALLSFMVDFELWGINPTGYHLTNILVHVANGLLIYHLLMRLYGERLLCLVASILFLFHPVQLESVAWVSERKGLLSMFFMLVSWEWYLSYRESTDRRMQLYFILSLSSFVLSLLAKPMSVVFPLLILLFDLSFPVSAKRARILDKLPYFLVAAIFAAIVMYSEMPQNGGGRVEYYGGSALATFLTMLPVFCKYIWMLLWPADLSMEYAPAIYRSISISVIMAALVLAGIAYGGVQLFRADRRLGFWLVLFWFALLPVSQIVPLSVIMFDHYLYLPIMGAAVLAGSGLLCLRTRVGSIYLRPLYAMVLLWLMALTVATYQRVEVWRNYWTLLDDLVAKTPDSDKVRILYGDAYQRAGNMKVAVRGFEEALKINPSSTDSMWRLGNLYTENGELEKGRKFLAKLLAIDTKNVNGWATLGDNYRKEGNYSEAEKAYGKALSLQPDAEHVIISLGKLAVLQKNFEQGRKFYNQIEAKGLSNPDNAYLMACLEALSGRRDESLAWFEKALQRGYRDYNTISTNKEMSELWNNPRFMFLLTQYFPDLEQ